jgi:hypothetical protein
MKPREIGVRRRQAVEALRGLFKAGHTSTTAQAQMVAQGFNQLEIAHAKRWLAESRIYIGQGDL